jgi:F1F0 ATPase subunit 2
MMMNDVLPMIPPFAMGLLLGAFFFGGLWWTVRKGLSSPNPALLFLSSALLRMGGLLAGFYFVASGQWQRLLACFTGFIIARLAVTWLTRSKLKEVRHAPES